jgi:outer membrane protein TolC
MTPCARAARLAGLSFYFLSGCASSYLNRAPSSPTEPWQLPIASPRFVRATREPAIQPGHVYTLPELIDIAELANPDTRIGWERARRAALAVGSARAEYFPIIRAWTIAGYQHFFFPAPDQSSVGLNSSEGPPSVSFPIPQRSGQSGYIGVDTFQVLPFLSIRWPVLDLGRADGVKAAENQSVAANAMFTAAHQRMMFEVARAYFRLGAARAQAAVNRDALERTRSIAKAADARFSQGVATVVELSEAKREVAQAEYNLAQAEAAEVNVYAALVSAMGIEPVVQFTIAINPSLELPTQLDEKVDDYVESALAKRPDLCAARARLPSTAAAVSRSESTYWPRITLNGTGGAAVLGAKVDGLGVQTVTIPNLTVAAIAEWMVFDGGLRDIQKELAHSQHSEAEQELVKLQQQIVQEVTTSYNELNADLSRYKAASALLGTARVADDAVTKAYTNGLATLTDAMNAEKARSFALAAKEQAFADALIAAAALAFSSGQLVSPAAVPQTVR